MGHSYDGAERRQFLRYAKNYSMFFYFRDLPDRKSDEAFIKDISRGGVRFTNSAPITPGTYLVFDIAIAYIAPKRLILRGVVISSKEIKPRLVYEIRAKFEAMGEETIQMFNMIEKLNLKDKKAHGLH